ncbi:MAG: DMT family transporter [Methylobacterium sp.]|nr:DMT family transporter [Rhodobacter sp.]MCA3648320.1 DMT family transporter [Methylobacterium sp.]MCA3658551.1 DMT family transporter [Methylobacterium sp.]MCA3664514.1 DMT family transporter [Methylobacterium sp.]MCA3665292.1 DMT family transporter [Methylobacterium sp.]
MSDSYERPAENKPVALLLLLLTTVMFATGDSIAKLAVGTLHPVQMLFVRCAIVVAFTVPYALWKIGPAVFHTDHPKTQVFRGFAILGSSFLFVSGLSHLPLADASAINFVWPLLITVLSVLMLKEKVGVRRWAATLLGFAGMLLIIRPGTSAFQMAALYPLGAALLWSFAAVVTRSVSAHDRAATTLVWTSLVMLAGATVLIPFFWRPMNGQEWLLMSLIGGISIVGHSMLVFAYERASASFLAPFSYAQLVWATILGYLVFGSLPDRWIAAGAILIVASGIYTAHREHVRAREARERAARGNGDHAS